MRIGLGSLGIAAALAGDVTPPPVVIDLIAFVESKSTGGQYYANQTTTDTAGTTPTTADGDVIARWTDQSTHGNHVTQGTSMYRGSRQTQQGVVMCQMVPSNSCYNVPAAAQGQLCTLWGVTQSGAMCESWMATSDMDIGLGVWVARFPVNQFSQFGWCLGEVTDYQRECILLTLNTGGFVDYHDMEVCATSFDTNNFYGQAYWLDPAFTDAGDTGSTWHFEFGVSADSAELPPFDMGYYQYITGLAPREYADMVISDATTLTAFGLGFWRLGTIGRVFDLTNAEVPALKIAQIGHAIMEGVIPPANTWPNGIEVVYLSSQNAPVSLFGRLPDITQRPSLRIMYIYTEHQMHGEFWPDLSMMTELYGLALGNNSNNISQITGNILAIGDCPKLDYFDCTYTALDGDITGLVLPASMRSFSISRSPYLTGHPPLFTFSDPGFNVLQVDHLPSITEGDWDDWSGFTGHGYIVYGCTGSKRNGPLSFNYTSNAGDEIHYAGLFNTCTGFTGLMPAGMKEFDLRFSNVDANTLDDILAAFVAVTYTGPGRRWIKLDGHGVNENGAPSAAGLVNKAILEGLGDTVGVN